MSEGKVAVTDRLRFEEQIRKLTSSAIILLPLDRDIGVQIVTINVVESLKWTGACAFWSRGQVAVGDERRDDIHAPEPVCVQCYSGVRYGNGILDCCS